MAQIQGPGEGLPPISRHDRILYEKEYRQGVDLFQRALNEYEKADEIHKKEAFREVMDRAMQVLNETARELKRTDLLDQNKKIEQSFQAFQDNDADPAKLAKNLDRAKDSIG
jgi:hypothetical protein